MTETDLAVTLTISQLRALIREETGAAIAELIEHEDRTLSHPEAAEYLGCSESTLYKLNLTHVRVGKENRYRLSVLREYRDSQQHGRWTPGRSA